MNEPAPNDHATPWMSVARAAAYVDVSGKTIRRLVADGKLEATYLTPRAMRISRKSLDDLIAGNSTNQSEEQS